MEKQKALEQSSLTSEDTNKKANKNLNEINSNSNMDKNECHSEYGFMDGVLGCVKI